MYYDIHSCTTTSILWMFSWFEKPWFTFVPVDHKVLAQVNSGVIRVSLVFSAELIHRKVNFPINMIIFNHLLFSHE